MEKLHDRTRRRDPKRTTCASGPLVALILYALLSPSLSATHVGGQPSKAHRLIFGNSASAPSPVERVDQEETRPAPAVVAAPAAVEASAFPAVEAPPARMLSDGAYLAVSGAVPLRFDAPRRWPPPLVLPAPEPVAEVAETPSPAPVVPTGPARVAAIEPPPVVPPPEPVEARTPPRPIGGPGLGRFLLTADQVLDHLGDFTGRTGDTSVRFKPALPADADLLRGIATHLP